MTMPDADDLSRTVLLAMHDGSQPTLEAAQAAHDATGLVIAAGEAVCRNTSGQAALLTAVVTGVRAFGRVLVHAEDASATIATGLLSGSVLGDAITDYGARIITTRRHAAIPALWPTLLIGSLAQPPSPDIADSAPVVLGVSWSGWTAIVRPAPAPVIEPSKVNSVLAAIAAAALGVSEAFGAIAAKPGSDAGHRSISLNLWSPGEDYDDGPATAHAPAAWWLIGLGHLGQAYSWVISWLNYVDPSMVQIVLQDTDRARPANHSTSMLTPEGSKDRYKTRLVAEALDAAGFDTRIIERRLDSGLHVLAADCHVALLGVDNLPARRLTSGVGWRFAVDAGLGSGPRDFSSILLRRFPAAQASDEVQAWAQAGDPPLVPASPAFTELRHRQDQCGVVELAGKAVGASFVGATTACLAIAESIRELHGGPGFDIITLNLDTMDTTRAPATVQADVISLPLKPTS
jgi:hypothetical protein